MLRTENDAERVAHANAEPASATADSVRVKVEEFTAAINRIEVRRSRELAQSAETVLVGQTLRELRIDVSAAEILEEIEQMRLDAAAEAESAAAIAVVRPVTAAKSAGVRKRRGVRFALAAIGAAAFFGLGSLVGPAVIQPAYIPPEASLGTISPGGELFVSGDDVQILLARDGAQFGDITASLRSSADFSWPIVDRGGKLFILGYATRYPVLPRVAFDLANNGPPDQLVAIPVDGTLAVSAATGNDGHVESLRLTTNTGAQAP